MIGARESDIVPPCRAAKVAPVEFGIVWATFVAINLTSLTVGMLIGVGLTVLQVGPAALRSAFSRAMINDCTRDIGRPAVYNC